MMPEMAFRSSVPVVIMLMLVPAAAYSVSCDNMHVCRFTDTGSKDSEMLIIPEHIITLERNGYSNVPIYGAVPDEFSGNHVLITVTSPAGDITEITVQSITDGTFHTYHTIRGIPESVGSYTVTAMYEGFEDEGGNVPIYDIGVRIIDVVLDGYDTGDHTITIQPGAASTPCARVDECYANGIVEAETGQTIRFVNNDDRVHRIHAVAAGYGNMKPEITKSGDANTPNAFDTGIMAPGDEYIVSTDVPGTILYTCRFHPHMEGVILIQGGEDVIIIPPKTITGIISDEYNPILNIHTSDDTFGNGARSMIINVTSESTDRGRVTVQITNRTNIIEILQLRMREGTASHEVITQPHWRGGEYTIYAQLRGEDEITSKTLTISDESICSGSTEQDSCFAGKITRIRGEIMKIGSINTRLAALIITNGTVLGDICPKGTFAIVDRDHVPGNMTADETPYASEVYCNDTSLNQMMLSDGHARLDQNSCGTSEFEWARCPEEPRLMNVTMTGNSTHVQPTSNGNCAIAFAAYGTKLAHDVQILREYRNEAGHVTGLLLDATHAAYYAVSPHIVNAQKASPEFRLLYHGIISMPIQAAVVLLGSY